MLPAPNNTVYDPDQGNLYAIMNSKMVSLYLLKGT